MRRRVFPYFLFPSLENSDLEWLWGTVLLKSLRASFLRALQDPNTASTPWECWSCTMLHQINAQMLGGFLTASYLKHPTESRTKPQTLQSHSVSLCAFFLATYLTKSMAKTQHITFTFCPMRTIPDTTECNTLYETYQRRQLLFTLQMLVSWNLTPETCFLLKSHFGSPLCCAFQTLTPTYE